MVIARLMMKAIDVVARAAVLELVFNCEVFVPRAIQAPMTTAAPTTVQITPTASSAYVRPRLKRDGAYSSLIQYEYCAWAVEFHLR